MLIWPAHEAIGAAWIVVRIINWASLAVMLLGVILFGRNLFKAATGPDRESPRLSPLIVGSANAVAAMTVFGAGAGLQALSIIIAVILHSRA